MRLFFWQKRSAEPPAPDTALRSYPYLWRIADHKRFDLGPNGLYRSADGEFIHLYLLQRIRWGQTHDYIMSHRGDAFPLGSQFFPEEPLPGQERLLKQLDKSERARAAR